MPDSSEVRLARLDEVLKGALNRLEAMSEAYAPTNRQVIENALKIAEIEKDIREIRGEIVKQVERREKDIDDLERQVLACSHGVGDLEGRWERRQQDVAEQLRKDRQLRNRWVIGLVAAFLTAVASVYLGTVLG